jgi:Tol biopolymer transport system component
MDLTDHSIKLLSDPGDTSSYYPAGFTPDGKWLVYTKLGKNSANSLWIFRSQDGHQQLVTLDGGEIMVNGISPDSDTIYYSGFKDGEYKVFKVSIQTGNISEESYANQKFKPYIWSPDHQRALVFKREQKTEIWLASNIDSLFHK